MNTLVMTITNIEPTPTGYYAKLVNNPLDQEFANMVGEQKMSHKVTYYVALKSLAAPKEQLIGKTIKFCPENYDVVESEFTPEGSNEPIKCKWCYAK